jgi:hypothetical protein
MNKKNTNTPILESRGNRPLKMTFEDQLHALIFFHLQEHESAFDFNGFIRIIAITFASPVPVFFYRCFYFFHDKFPKIKKPRRFSLFTGGNLRGFFIINRNT